MIHKRSKINTKKQNLSLSEDALLENQENEDIELSDDNLNIVTGGNGHSNSNSNGNGNNGGGFGNPGGG